MRYTLFGALLALAACGGGNTATTTTIDTQLPPPHPVTPAKPTGPLDAAGLAAQIDPGALPGGLGATPPGVDEVIHAMLSSPPPDLGAALTASVASVAGVNGNIDLAVVGPILNLIALTTTYEDTHHDACPLACLTQLASAYRVLDIPMLADSSNAMSKALEVSITRAAGAGDAEKVIATLHWAFSRAPLRQRQLTAEMLRKYPDEPETLEAVRNYARRTVDREDWDGGWITRQYIAARTEATADDRQAAARACLQTLSAACAPATGIDDTVAQAAIVQRLRGSTQPEDQLVLSAALVQLGHLSDAKALLNTLTKTLPHDARPIAGLADIALREVLGNPEARVLLDSALTFDHKDQAFYELYLGTLFVDVLNVFGEVGKDQTDEQIVTFLTKRLQPISDAVEGYAQFQPARAAVLRVMVQGAILLGTAVALPKGPEQDKHMDAALLQIFTRAIAVRAQYPNERDAHLLVILLSHFKPGSWAAIDQALMVDVPVGVTDRTKVLGERANALFHEALSSGKPDRVTQLQAWLAEIPTEVDGKPVLADLRADLTVLQVALKHATWADVAGVYRALLPSAADDETRARYENNVATALYRAGNKGDAEVAWNQAAALQPAAEAVRLNRAAVAGPTADSIATLTTLSTDAESAGVRFQASAWLRAFAVQKGDKKQPTVAALHAKVLTGTSSVQPAGEYGLVSMGSFQVGLGYSTTERLVVNLSVTTKASLVLPAPGTGK